MNFDVHIERLILEGIDLAEQERPALQRAVSAELRRLLELEGLSARGRQPGYISRLPGGGVEMAPGQSTAELGRQIARAVYQGMNR